MVLEQAEAEMRDQHLGNNGGQKEKKPKGPIPISGMMGFAQWFSQPNAQPPSRAMLMGFLATCRHDYFPTQNEQPSFGTLYVPSILRISVPDCLVWYQHDGW
jgi:hypothetical protein